MSKVFEIKINVPGIEEPLIHIEAIQKSEEQVLDLIEKMFYTIGIFTQANIIEDIHGRDDFTKIIIEFANAFECYKEGNIWKGKEGLESLKDSYEIKEVPKEKWDAKTRMRIAELNKDNLTVKDIVGDI